MGGGAEEGGAEGGGGGGGEVDHALPDHAFPGAVSGDGFGGGAAPEEGVVFGCEGFVGLGG